MHEEHYPHDTDDPAFPLSAGQAGGTGLNQMREQFYLSLAINVAARNISDVRSHAIGAVALRMDGAIVKARNGSDMRPNPAIHAEHRVMRKAGYGAIVYVARHRKDGRVGLAKPCPACLATLRNKGAKRVYFTVTGHDFDCIQLQD